MLTDAETVAKKIPGDVSVLEMLEGAATETIKVALGTTRSARISPLCCLKDTNFGQWQGTKHKVAENTKKRRASGRESLTLLCESSRRTISRRAKFAPPTRAKASRRSWAEQCRR